MHPAARSRARNALIVVFPSSTWIVPMTKDVASSVLQCYVTLFLIWNDIICCVKNDEVVFLLFLFSFNYRRVAVLKLIVHLSLRIFKSEFLGNFNTNVRDVET